MSKQMFGRPRLSWRIAQSLSLIGIMMVSTSVLAQTGTGVIQRDE
jgi:hypothetical protein